MIGKIIERTGMEIVVNGKIMVISGDIIKELHRQENILIGKDIYAFYAMDYPKKLSEDELEILGRKVKEYSEDSYYELGRKALSEMMNEHI